MGVREEPPMRKAFAALCLSAVTCSGTARAEPIPDDVLTRVFKIGVGDKQGTCFAVDFAGRQYLVTAAHLFKTDSEHPSVTIWRDGSPKPLEVARLPVERGHDIAVLVAKTRFGKPASTLEPAGHFYLGQEVHLLGFPYGRGMETFKVSLNAGFPIPLVRRGIISRLSTKDDPTLLIDAIGNHGFSGGPVLVASGGNFSVIGVVSENNVMDGVVTGFIEVTRINLAVDAISRNPVGLLGEGQ